MPKDLQKQITNAIGAHGVWKLRLGSAIATGRADVKSADVCRDDRCEFGRWLHGPELGPDVRRGKPYQVVRRLHAEFHDCAGKVLHCVEVGKKAEARDLLDHEYAERSDKLLRALAKWKREAAQDMAA